MPKVEINGAQINYEIAGEGAAVAFLHAGIADRRMWDDQFEVFAQRYRVLRYDLRGFGETTAPAMDYAHHDDLRALLDHLGIERAALVGCSNGGRVAMNFTLTNPHRVAALAMIGSAPEGFKFDGESPALWDEIVKAFDAGDLECTADLEAQLWVVGPNRPREAVDAAVLAKVRAMNLIALQNEVAGVGDEQSLTPPAAERLGELHLPALVVVGANDSPVTVAAGAFMAANIAGAEQVIMPDTAHLPSMEHPAEFNRILLDFLRQHI